MTQETMAPLSRIAALLAAGLCALALIAGCTPAADDGARNDAATPAASSSAQEANEAPAAEVSVSVTVNGEANGIVVNDAADMSVEAGATALDALQLVSSDVVVEDSDYGPFVTSISGLANEGASGWTYTINGEYATESAGERILADGDALAWTYYVS